MANKKEVLAQTQLAIAEYFELSKYLFDENAPQDVHDIPEDNQFYEVAKDIADEMKLDWDSMSHEDSNKVMLNLLAEYFAGIQPDGDYHPVLTVSFKKS